MQTIIFFDIDHTLFHTRKYIQFFYQAIKEKLHITDEDFSGKIEKIYRQYIDSREQFYPSEFGELIAKSFHKEEFTKEIIACILDPLNFQRALYPDVKKVLHELSNQGVLLGIFSRGITRFQELKIVTIKDYFAPENIYIFEEKEKKLTELLADYLNHTIYLVDDLPKILKIAKDVNPSITSIWITNGHVERNRKEVPDFVPDYTIHTLEEILGIIKKN